MKFNTKIIIALAATISMTVSAHASVDKTGSITSSVNEGINCKSLEDLAHTVMTARQLGMSISKVLQIVIGAETDPAWKEFAKTMVTMAYDKPQYSTEKYRNQAATEFANEMALACYSK